MGRLSRRDLIARGAAGGAALALGGALAGPAEGAGFGPLIRDTSGGLLDLPHGFRYQVISDPDSVLANGAPLPGNPDGMAAFRRGALTLLVRNHELLPADVDRGLPPVPQTNPWDPAGPGGTTAVLLDERGRKVREFVTSSGTISNCAGGATPWGTWLTCEEDVADNHGWVFEVDPLRPERNLSRTPILGMGKFAHEAIDIDPSTGIAYLTEDDSRGSSLFRYVPDDPTPRPAALRVGGRLQVLCVEDVSRYDADLAAPGQQFGVVWKDVDPAKSRADAIAKGGVRFNRLEGCHFGGDAFWFSDTAGGEEGRGQIFRLIPLPGGDRLELFCEATQANGLDAPDNLVLTAWGDVWFAEDGGGADRVMGVTPGGEKYKFARNRLNSTELCGPCFSPSGTTFFVNIQDPPITLAITGPFPRRAPLRQRQMAAASPPEGLGPRVRGELADAAMRLGMTELEAAAYDRLGVTLT